MVPEGWRNVQIGDIAEISVGRDLREDHFSEFATQSHIFPVFSNTVENNGLYGFYDFQEYHGDALTIVGRGIGLGRAFYKEGGFGAIGRLLVLRSKDESFCARFLSDYVNHILRIHNESGGIPQLPGGSLSNYWVTLPPLAEQRRIAEVLGVWDRAIEVAGKQLDLARTQKRALMQTLLTPTRRFPGYEGQPWKEVRLGDAEEKGWLQLGRGNVISKKDIEADPGEYPIYSSSVVGNGEFGRYAQYMFDEEMITWSVDGGGHFFHRKPHKFSVTNVCGWMRVNLDVLNYRFMAAQLQFLHQRLQFDYQSKAHPSVIRTIYELKIPSLAEQRAIAEVLDDAETEITTLETQITRLQAEKKALMQQLLTGQKRLAV